MTYAAPVHLLTRGLVALSLFTLGPALIAPTGARAAGTQTDPRDEDEDEGEEAKAAGPLPRTEPPEPIQPRPFEPEIAATAPVEMPEPYQPPDPYDIAADRSQIDTAADPSQIDWPQDVTAEEAAVDSYDDGYDPQAYTQFKDELAPYGDWHEDAYYGNVWTPNASLVGADFTPYYTGGHWVLTEYGWTWVSDWTWGWAPFHYGRWVVITGFGWSWVPGTMWGPAWVAWRSGGGWVGWAALPPRGVSVTTTYGRRTPWRFTRAGDLGARRIRCVQMNQMKGMFRRTSPVANDRVLTRGNATVHINAGPRYIPNATPVRLKSVAPHAFPQRAIYPRPGVKMAVRPWIRAARAAATSGVGAPIGGGAGVGGAGVGGAGVGGGRGAARPGFSGHAAPPAFSPHVYNPPPGPSGAGPHTFTPPAHPNSGRIANTVPRVYDPLPATAPRVHDVTPGQPRFHSPPPSGGRYVSDTPSTFAPPRTFGGSPTFGQPPTPAAPRFGQTPTFTPTHTLGTLPVENPGRVYKAPPRTFTTPPNVDPPRSFGSAPAFGSAPTFGSTPTFGSAPAFSRPSPPSPAPRTFAPAPVHAPAPQHLHQGFARPQIHAPAPQRSFNAPAAGGWGQPGGGMRFGGGARR
jgi:hypothetical protein